MGLGEEAKGLCLCCVCGGVFFSASGGAGGVVGGPVPFLSVVKLQSPGDYTLFFSVMRIWAPNSAVRYALKIHVAN